MASRTYHIPVFARQLGITFGDGILCLDIGGMHRQIRLLPSSISYGPIEPGQMSIDSETGLAKGGNGIQSRQYKTERDLLENDIGTRILPAIEAGIVGALKWLETET